MRSRNADEIMAECYAERFINSIIFAYNGYKNGTKTINDIIQTFHIKIDEYRLSDYELISLNYSDQISLEFIDKKYNTLYTAKLILSYYTGALAYIRVDINSSTKKIKKLINIRDG